MTEVICPYCNKPAEFVSGEVIYPHREDLYEKKFWLCRPCEAYVGCHAQHPKYSPLGDTPLGRLADYKLRKAKSAAHTAFDPLWRDEGIFLSRKDAYSALANTLDIPVSECHIGFFDLEQCLAVIEAAKLFRAEMKSTCPPKGRDTVLPF